MKFTKAQIIRISKTFLFGFVSGSQYEEKITYVKFNFNTYIYCFYECGMVNLYSTNLSVGELNKSFKNRIEFHQFLDENWDKYNLSNLGGE